jgi:hypothetical protein
LFGEVLRHLMILWLTHADAPGAVIRGFLQSVIPAP